MRQKPIFTVNDLETMRETIGQPKTELQAKWLEWIDRELRRRKHSGEARTKRP